MHCEEKGQGGRGLDWSDAEQGQVAGFCKHGNEPSGFVKCWASLDSVKNDQLPKWDPAPQSVGFETELHGLAKQSKAQLNLKIFKTMTVEFQDSWNATS